MINIWLGRNILALSLQLQRLVLNKVQTINILFQGRQIGDRWLPYMYSDPIRQVIWLIRQVRQWNLSIKDTLNKGHLSNEDTVCSPNHIELCTNLSLN